jgi:hypothetical protein
MLIEGLHAPDDHHLVERISNANARAGRSSLPLRDRRGTKEHQGRRKADVRFALNPERYDDL